MKGRALAASLSRLAARAKGRTFLPACLAAMACFTGSRLPAATTVSLSPASATVQALGSQSLTATASAASTFSWSVDGVAGGNATVGTITAQAQSGASSTAGVRGVYSGSGKSLTVPVQAGDLVVVAWEVGNSPATTSCSDSGGNTYKQVGNAVYASGMDACGYLFYGVAKAANPSLQVVIKSLDTSSIAMQVTVLKGMSTDLGSVLDGYTSSIDASYGNSHSTGTVNTSASGDVLVALWAQDYKSAVLTDSGTGFTLGTQASDGSCSAYKLAGAAGSYKAAVTSSSYVQLGSILAAFKASPATSSASTATYTAPATGGTHTVTCLASNASGSASGSASITVVASAPAPPPPSVTVSVAPATASVVAGATASFTASVTGSTTTSVTWSVDGVPRRQHHRRHPLEARGSSVTYTAPSAGGQPYRHRHQCGRHRLRRVRGRDGRGRAGEPSRSALRARPPSPPAGPWSSRLRLSGTSNRAVTWSVDGAVGRQQHHRHPLPVPGSTAIYTAPAATGTHSVSATSVANPSATGTCQITVATPSAGVSVSLTPNYAWALGSGATLQFSASVSGSSNPGVVWSVDGLAGGNSTVGTISPSGLYPAPSSTTPAIHAITAAAQADASGSATQRILTVPGTKVVNAKTWSGATGNGSTDDTSAIGKALSAASGGICYLPAGTYMINARGNSGKFGLYIPQGTTLLMDPGATLQCITQNASASQQYAVIGMEETYSSVVGGTIIGDRVARNLPTFIDGSGKDYECGMGIEIADASNFIVLGVTAKNHCCDGFYVCNNTSGVLLSDCVADNNRRQGMSVTWVNGLTVQYSTFTNSNGNDPACGIDLEPNAGQTIQNVLITHCTLKGNVGGGLAGGGSHADGPTGSGSAVVKNCTVTQCTITGNGGNNYKLGGVYWDESESCSILDNTIENNLADGINVFYLFTNGQVVGNTVSGNQGNGITLGGNGLSGECAGTAVNGNTVSGNSGAQISNASGSGAIVGSNP